MGLQDELGTLEPGKRADLVVVDGDPFVFATLKDRIVEVWKDGVGSCRSSDRSSRARNRNPSPTPSAYPGRHDRRPGGPGARDRALHSHRRAPVRHADASQAGHGRDRHGLPRPDRRRAGRRQDHPGSDAGQTPRVVVAADPVHTGPHADGRHRDVRARHAHERLRVPARTAVRPGRPADEINRATPKTQAALLEAMQEHRSRSTA